MKLKNRLAAFFSAALLIVGAGTVSASDINVVADGNSILFDVAPQIINDRTMVPMRAVFEALGADIVWDDTSKTVTGTKGNTSVSLTIGNSTMINNGAEIYLDSPPVIIEGRTLVPVRAIAEGLNAGVRWDADTKTVYINTSAEGKLTVSYIDVGQGDSELIILPNGKTILIDAGSAGTGVAQFIKSRGITRLDYVIVTHNHEDHIGGMAEVINTFDIGEIYMPEKPHTTKTFENLLLAIDAKGLKINKATAGTVIYEDSDTNAALLAPSADFDDLNNSSAILKLTYKDTSFLFTGDAERESLALISGNPDSDVYKVGHHGSSNATTEAFLDAVTPEHAIISCGAGNSYGHPHSEVLAMLSARGIKVYRTDECGTINAVSDGVNITIDKNQSEIMPNAPPIPTIHESVYDASSETQVKESGYDSLPEITVEEHDYNTSTVYRTKTGAKYHKDGCSYLKSKIQTTVSEAQSMGLEPCSRCNP